MRIVVDTSVFVAAVSRPDGASREVMRRCLLDRYEPLVWQALLAQYESVLARAESPRDAAAPESSKRYGEGHPAVSSA